MDSGQLVAQEKEKEKHLGLDVNPGYELMESANVCIYKHRSIYHFTLILLSSLTLLLI